MISSDLVKIIADWKSERVVRVVVASIKGSAPREAGAFMWVGEHEFIGTIGGGRLEFEALSHARDLLGKARLSNWYKEGRSWPLGVELGQCCGGMVDLVFEIVDMVGLEKFPTTATTG